MVSFGVSTPYVWCHMVLNGVKWCWIGNFNLRPLNLKKKHLFSDFFYTLKIFSDLLRFQFFLWKLHKKLWYCRNFQIKISTIKQPQIKSEAGLNFTSYSHIRSNALIMKYGLLPILLWRFLNGLSPFLTLNLWSKFWNFLRIK